METVTNKLYEAMFLVDSSLAAQDWDGILGTIEGILKRADAETVLLRKWGDKRLAYEIDHKARGTYILCYFRADGGRIGDIEKDVRLSERIMRVLILSTEGRAPQDIEKDTVETPAEDRKTEAVQAAEEIEKDTVETPAEDRKTEAVQAAEEIEKDTAETLAEDRKAEAVQAAEEIEKDTAETLPEDRKAEAAQESEVEQAGAEQEAEKAAPGGE